MAAGSHLENGIWALLVMAARVRHAMMGGEMEDGNEWILSQWPWFKSRAMQMRRKASPSRFISAVIIPAPRAVGVWK